MTNATISLIKNDGTITGIRVFSDGMLEETGRTLLENYTTEAEVEELISYGCAVRIMDTISSCEFYVRDDGQEWELNAPIKDVLDYSSETPVGDFREKWDFGEAYNYTFKDGKWFISGGYFYEYNDGEDEDVDEDEDEYEIDSDEWIELTPEFIEKYKEGCD